VATDFRKRRSHVDLRHVQHRAGQHFIKLVAWYDNSGATRTRCSDGAVIAK
jgi:hypothetical protein